MVDFAALTAYPTIIDYGLKFGDQLSQVYKLNHSYEFVGTCQNQHCYYLISMYQNSYGLDDIRKPEFSLTLTAT